MKKHFDLLDGIKFVAAVLIIFHHYQQEFLILFSGLDFYWGKIEFAYLVELFFMISGFVAAESLMNKFGWGNSIKDVFAELKHKAIRIYPISMMACLLELIIAIAYYKLIGSWPHEQPEYWNWECIVSSFFLVFQGWPGLWRVGINNPTWYLCILLLCYGLYYFEVFLIRLFPFFFLSLFCYTLLIYMFNFITKMF